jgi:hypothetical protein
MPLTPQGRIIVDAIRDAARPPEEIGPEAARAASDALRATQVRETEPVHRVEDRAVPGSAGPVPTAS